MKQNLSYTILAALVMLFLGCKKYESNYPGGVVNPIISIYDLKTLYKNQPLVLSPEVMFGSEKITGVVTSDHSGGNLPDGLLVVQQLGRLNMLRSMAINIGADAANYKPGDSVVINVAGGTLQRVDHILQITGVNNASVSKISSGHDVKTYLISDASKLAENADVYENALAIITKAEFDPPQAAGSTFNGDKTISDGAGDLILHTDADAAFASKTLPFLATYTGILIMQADSSFKLFPRTVSDIIVLSDKPPVVAPVIITGFLNNAFDTDPSFEYIQLMATKDIDFAATNMAVVVCNNAGTAGAPAKGWAEGGSRSYKLNLTSGTTKKGTYFYVGGSGKLIGGQDVNDNPSTDISSANWIVSRDYATVPGDDGIGNATTGLMANSGNPAGVAVFDTKNVTETTVPVDVVFYGMTSNSNTFAVGNPPKGYLITNTDYYETQNTAVPTLDPQPYYLMGTNMFKFVIVNDENFRSLGGTYNIKSGKWTTKRTVTPIKLSLTSQLSEIEGKTTLSEVR